MSNACKPIWWRGFSGFRNIATSQIWKPCGWSQWGVVQLVANLNKTK